MVAVHCDIHVHCDRDICSGAYANNMRCMYTSVFGNIANCSKYILCTYTDKVVSYLYLK